MTKLHANLTYQLFSISSSIIIPSIPGSLTSIVKTTSTLKTTPSSRRKITSAKIRAKLIVTSKTSTLRKIVSTKVTQTLCNINRSSLEFKLLSYFSILASCANKKDSISYIE